LFFGLVYVDKYLLTVDIYEKLYINARDYSKIKRLILAMSNRRIWRLDAIKMVRLSQLLLLVVALWFIYWTHIYEMTVWNKTFIASLQSSLPNVFIYSVSIITLIILELKTRRFSHVSMVKPSAISSEDLPRENTQIKKEKMKSDKIPSKKIGISLVVIGALLLFASVLDSSTVLAFIGLGLTFWGVLFLFARPTRFVRIALLDSTAISTYTTIDRMLDNLNYKGKPVYIPPYPKESYLPEHLKGLKEMVLFISADANSSMPSIEELAKKQFLVKNPKGICITPPGSGLVSLLEKQLKIGFTQVDPESFYDSLKIVIVKELELANNLVIEDENDLIHVKIIQSVYKNLYSQGQTLKSVHAVGCPLTSALACILAQKTGKPVTIKKSNVSLDLRTIEMWFQTVEG